MNDLRNYYYKNNRYADGSERSISIDEIPENFQNEIKTLRIEKFERVGQGYVLPDGLYLIEDHTGLHIQQIITLSNQILPREFISFSELYSQRDELDLTGNDELLNINYQLFRASHGNYCHDNLDPSAGSGNTLNDFLATHGHRIASEILYHKGNPLGAGYIEFINKK